MKSEITSLQFLPGIARGLKVQSGHKFLEQICNNHTCLTTATLPPPRKTTLHACILNFSRFSTFVSLVKVALQGIFLKVALFFERTKKFQINIIIYEYCITVLRLLRTFVSDWRVRNMDPALICLDKGCTFSPRKSAHTTGGPSSVGEFF